MDQYCNPDKVATFATPTTNVVNVYPMEIPQVTYLAPCAQSGVSAAIANVVSIERDCDGGCWLTKSSTVPVLQRLVFGPLVPAASLVLLKS